MKTFFIYRIPRIAFFTFLFLLFSFSAVSARSGSTGVTPPGGSTGRTPGGVDFELPNPLSTRSISELIEKITDFLAYRVAPPLAVLMIVVGAFYFLTAGGNEERVRKGKQIITWTVVGFMILLLASAIAGLIAELLGADTSRFPSL